MRKLVVAGLLAAFAAAVALPPVLVTGSASAAQKKKVEKTKTKMDKKRPSGKM